MGGGLVGADLRQRGHPHEFLFVLFLRYTPSKRKTLPHRSSMYCKECRVHVLARGFELTSSRLGVRCLVTNWLDSPMLVWFSAGFFTTRFYWFFFNLLTLSYTCTYISRLNFSLLVIFRVFFKNFFYVSPKLALIEPRFTLRRRRLWRKKKESAAWHAYRWGTEYIEWQRPLSAVHSIMMEKLAHSGDGGGCTPTRFHNIYSTITKL